MKSETVSRAFQFAVVGTGIALGSYKLFKQFSDLGLDFSPG